MKQILNLIKRKWNARKIGIKFTRAANFRIPEKIKINGKEIKIASLDDIGSKTAFIEIFLDDCYKIRKLKNENIKTILDIGGHSGFFSLHCRNIFPDAHIHAYEPNPKMAEIIKANSQSGNFIFFDEAVDLKDSAANLIINNNSVLTKTIEKTNGNIILTAFSKCLQRLDASVDLLKMDCEGAEWEILKDKQSSKKVKFLTMEYHLEQDQTLKKLTSRLKALNYTISHFNKGETKWGLLQAKMII